VAKEFNMQNLEAGIMELKKHLVPGDIKEIRLGMDISPKERMMLSEFARRFLHVLEEEGIIEVFANGTFGRH